MSKPSYYAITSVGVKFVQRNASTQVEVMDWYILVGPCVSRDEAHEKGVERIGPTLNDWGQGMMEEQTALKNMTVVPKSQLTRYGLKS